MNPRIPRILVMAPGGPDGLAAVVAAGRAGSLGILDLAGEDPSALRSARERLERWADRPFGVRVDPAGFDPEGWPERLAAVVLRGGDRPDDRAEAIRAIRRSGRAALVEVVDRAEARSASEAGADGLIAAGLEAGGRCGEESSFVLLQGIRADGAAPCWVRGGIGPDSAAACLAAGAAGVVLDGAVLLARESPLDEGDRARVARLDGAETARIGPADGNAVRVDAPPGSPAIARLRAAAEAGGDAWRAAVVECVGWRPGQARPIGQDAAFAPALAGRFGTVGGIVAEVSGAIDRGLASAATCRPLAPGAPLAVALGTRHPIVQGPMTRVSDSAAFADAVSRGGALPMLALAMLRGPEAAALLAETAGRLGDRPWGVGLLGFVDPALRAEQLGAIREARPPFALIAGGRPDQADELERLGIRTFLHAPSPGLLARYLKDGARRFVLEGRECGGHVGPRSSLVLWQQAAAEIRGALDRGAIGDPGDLHLLFAGGIHDARSAAGVAALAGPLAERGVKVGILIGTAYLFTREAVSTGAIAARFQGEALRCRSTVLLPTGPGHEVRAVPSPYTAQFAAERRRLVEAGASAEEIREALERLNVGRLRVASKGVERSGGDGARLEPLPEAEQYERGLYMIGQAAALRDRVTTIAALHEELSEGSTALLDRPAIEPATAEAPRPSDVAIVGMAAIMPGAADARAFWANTLKGVDAIVEVPADRWDWRPYYDPDGKAPDKIVSRWGGFLPDVPFDPLRYGMPPSSVPSIEPAQLLVLEAVSAALDDAGYAARPFPKERTAVVLGMGGGAAQLAMGYAFRSYLPMLESLDAGAARALGERARRLLPEWTEDAFPGFLLNVTAGRVANRFDLGGANYTVDAACGSSLAAASLAVRELETGAADMVILGGADTVQNPFTYLAFSKTHAFSPRGRCRPFDASADGIVISEGVGVVVLKRLADAERDGDRIYAVIKGLGSSSDGRARGLTAPNGDGQARALERAYAKAGVAPSSVGYVEAHGTGTAVGDVVEVNALAAFLRRDGAAPASCAVGSVKSMIGHTKCAAGLAGLINATLALYHRVLPPTIGVERPNPAADLGDGPLRVSTEPRPWLHAGARHPRRAGVSAFGFGGTNFHAVLEAYEADPSPRPAALRDWPAELFLWRAEDRDALRAAVDRLAGAIDAGARPEPRDLSHALLRRFDAGATDRPTLAIVATSIDHLRELLAIAGAAIGRGEPSLSDPRGIHFAERPALAGQAVAFLFPGQGAQRPEMLLDLALAFDEVRGAFDAFDEALLASGRSAVGPKVFPPTALDEAARERARLALTATDAAQPAVGAASVGVLRLLAALGIAPDAVGGHSYGELVALHAAGALGVGPLAALSEARGRLMIEAAGPEPGVMAALACDADRAAALIDGIGGVVLANRNGPRQAVIAGPRDAVNRAIDRARAGGVRAFDLPVGAAFHSPIVAGAGGPLAGLAARLLERAPSVPVFSNLDARPHPGEPAEIARRLGEHLASPVRFEAMVEAMHDAGIRVFLECGPGSILAPLVGSILGDRPHLAVSTDAPGRPGIPTFLTALARLIAAGVPAPRLDRLTGRRGPCPLDLDRLADAGPALPASTWLVNGSRARPIGGPEPARLGMAPELIGLAPPAEDATMRHPAEPAADAVAEAPAPAPSAPAPEPPRNGHASPAHRPAPGAIAPGAFGADRAGAERPHASAGTNGAHAPGRNGHAHASPKPSAVPTPAATPRGAERVMESFQETMRAFLDVQRDTMLAYLAGRAAAPASMPREAHPAPVEGAASRVPSPPGTAFESPRDVPPSGHESPRSSDDPRGAQVNGHAGTPVPIDRSAPTAGEAVRDQPAREAVPDAVADRPDETGGRGGASIPAGAAHAAPGPRPAASVADRLVEIVRDRTGYPAEMLGMTLDLEADLGIDSIKRVEILGSLRDAVEGLAGLGGSGLMDRLSRAKTLGQIVEQVESALAQAAGPAEPAPIRDREQRPADREGPLPRASAEGAAAIPPAADQTTPANGTHRLRRLVLDAVACPLPARRGGLLAGGTVIVTDDGRGVAAALRDRLHALGLGVELAGDGWADLTSPSAVADRLAALREGGPIAGILHAQPLGDAGPEGLDPSRWSDRLGPSLRGLFLLARAAADDLERSARLGGACLVAATAMGGAYGSGGGSAGAFFPGQGGIAGLVKTLAREWPEVRARVVDLDPSEPAALLADRLASEAVTDDGWAEVGYLGGARIRLRTVERPFGAEGPRIELGRGEPVVITGGARGITAAAAVELARRWRPTLLLVGSSPMPPDAEEPGTAGIDAAPALKAALLDRLRGGGKAVGPSDVERAYRSLMRAREIRGAIARMRAEGAVVEYARADVRDAAALAGALDSWRSRYGDPVGLIHGAGVIHDKWLRDKTPESFDRVLGTKLDGALNLARLLRPEALRFAALFSSVAGRFGNRGQSDYAAANEALNKLALWLDRRWPGRVVSINWGPWAGVGMVSDLQEHLGRRGLGMIDPAAGCEALVEELRFGRKGDVEVVLAGDLGTLDGPLPEPEAAPAGASR